MTGNIIDREALTRLREAMGGAPDDLAELIEDFTETAPAIAAAMRACHARGDLAACGIEAHSLKSNARDMGAVRLADLCLEQERACKAGLEEDVGARLDAIDAALSEALEALAQVEAADV